MVAKLSEGSESLCNLLYPRKLLRITGCDFLNSSSGRYIVRVAYFKTRRENVFDTD
jgi:hypothetical protein